METQTLIEPIDEQRKDGGSAVSLAQAAVLYKTSQPLAHMSLMLPSLGPEQVLVEVAYSGLCRTQLLEMQGQKGPDRFLPHTLGHEGSGMVLDVGSAVKKVRPGDHVVLSWIKGEGGETLSTRYESEDGWINSGPISTFMTHTVTCENRVTPIPKTMPLREAALLGCAVPTGAGIVLNTMQLRSDHSVMIVGLGGIGLSALLAARSVKARTIIAVDMYQHKLDLAQIIGATHTLNIRTDDVQKEVLRITGGRGVDCAIEAVGRRDAMESAFSLVRTHGGLCVLAGNVVHGEKIAIDPFDLIRGKKLVGTWGGETVPERDIRLYIEKYLSGHFPLESLVTHEYPLEEINHAVRVMESGDAGRVLIRMNPVSSSWS